MKKAIIVMLILSLCLQSVSCKKENLSNDVLESETCDNVFESTETPTDINDVDSYRNPISKLSDKDVWKDYGVGDPFVMRFNGRYYLYCSTKDGEIGIQCWSSENLVNWKYEGLCAKEELTNSAYAPEVVYYNGYFYMYTSPAGNGHYVLKSESPTGPFYAVTDNFGLSIDGDVFIDDDGSWYFYCAGYDGIMAYPMSAPDKIDVESGKKIQCDMHGWTEGSMIVKHNGVYYMTYTGNHVWSSGYRINYATSTESPLDFECAENNPLLLSTDSKTVMGIGHSSTVVGPNLDEYYIVYHSFKTVPIRSMNIDRIVFNGNETVVLGPTTDKQQAPQMPDLYSYFENQEELDDWKVINGNFRGSDFALYDGGRVISKQNFDGDYTAEYNLKSVSESAGIIFSYRDDQNYARAIYDAVAHELKVEFSVNGEVTEKLMAIRGSFSEKLKNDALVVFTVRKSGDKYTVFVNNREVFECESTLGGGSIGVSCEKGLTTVGFVGVTNGALQSTLKDVYKPIESVIPAFSCVDRDAEIMQYNGVQYLRAVADKKYEYNVNVTRKGNYDIVLEYQSSEVCVLDIYQGNDKVGEISLPSSNGKLSRMAGRNMSLLSGLGTVTLAPKSGSADILNFSFHEAESVTEKSYDFKNNMSSAYKDGYWRLEDGQLVLKGEFGKFMVGSENWSNYTVESDIIITSDTANAGLCVRVSNPSTHVDNRLSEGSDYLQGYFIGFGDGRIFLGKHNYDWKELKSVAFDMQKGQSYRLKVEVNENVLQISVDGKLIMTYTDIDAPFLHGMVGYRAHSCSMVVDNLTVRPIS